VRLAEKRHSMRMRWGVFFLILLLFLLVLADIGLWQPAVRVEHITISPSDAQLNPLVQKALAGTYAYIIPRDSIFFFPAGAIRSAILSARPDVAAVSIARTGFSSLAIKLDSRTPLARWCGTAASSSPADILAQDIASSVDGSCYLFDTTGFLYARTPAPHIASTSVTFASTTASTAAPLVPFPLYAPLASSSAPFLNTIAHAADLPPLFDLARQMHSFGTSVNAIVLRGGEADLFLASGTRVTYILGKEQQAYSLLEAVKNKISLSNGSLVYVDLRFPGKVYFLPVSAVKKKGG